MAFRNTQISPGQAIRLTVTITDADGVLTDPTTVTFKWMSPSGTESSFVNGTDTEVSKTSTGIYNADVTPDKGGRWYFRWLTTGDVLAKDGHVIVTASPFVDGIKPRAYCR